MKTLRFLMLSLTALIVICFTIDSYAAKETKAKKTNNNSSFKIPVYGGLNFGQTSSEDFENFHLSDWENYGTGTSEGRTECNLGEKEPSAVNYGIMLGARYEFIKDLSALAEIQLNFSSGVNLFGIYAGVNYDFITTKTFSLGATPKIGYVSGKADLGKVEMLPGKTAPVIADSGTYNVGDEISLEFSGAAISLGLTPRYDLTDNIAIVGYIGYTIGFLKSDGLKVGDKDLSMSDPAVVQPVLGSTTNAGIDPQINITGISIQLGAEYTFNI